MAEQSFEGRVEELILQLHSCGALKFGDFKMKVGVNSPVYFDLRVMVSYPQLMNSLSKLMWEFAVSKNLVFDHLCGVPYTALPIATLMSVQANVPMLMRRKEAKKYGTTKLIEGSFKQGEKCLIVEDVCTSGSSILDTFYDIEKEGLVATDTVIVVDREQGGTENLTLKGVNIHSLTTLSRVMEILLKAKRVDTNTVANVRSYIAANRIDLVNGAPPKKHTPSSTDERTALPFSSRIQHAKCSLAAKLFKIMEEKRSNMCLAADVNSSSELLKLAQTVGPYIVIFKTHVDIIKDFTIETAKQLTSVAKQHNFLIMEDRKFADIGETVRQQYCAQCPWADLVTAHSLPGDGVMDALKSAFAQSSSEPRGVFVVSQLSSKNNLITPEYTKETVKMVEPYHDIVAGFVSQSPDVLQSPGHIQLTPGVSLSSESDGLGQQYSSPDIVIGQKGADIAVVGRGITKASNIEEIAKQYQKILWTSYQNRIKTN